MKYISFLIKPASSLCNMHCRYCFYYDVSEHRKIKSYGIMSEEVMHALIDRSLALSEDATITYAFQGGEPTLAKISYFKQFVAYVNKHRKKHTIHYALQTNAILLNEEWADFFLENKFLIGISLDGYAELHDYFRIDKNHQNTFKKVMKSINLLKDKGVEFNILSVLNSTLAKHPQKLFSFYLKNDLKYVQLIPCIPGLDEENNPYSLSPKQFSSFYKKYFDLWLEELKKGNYMSVTLFDNIIPMFIGRLPQQCGMLGKCAPQFVIESNGDVFPCDFYVLDEYQCGNIINDDLSALAQKEVLIKFLQEERRNCKACDDCPFISICHRNCKRLNLAYYNEHYCGYREFLEYAYMDMQKIANYLK